MAPLCQKRDPSFSPDPSLSKTTPLFAATNCTKFFSASLETSKFGFLPARETRQINFLSSPLRQRGRFVFATSRIPGCLKKPPERREGPSLCARTCKYIPAEKDRNEGMSYARERDVERLLQDFGVRCLPKCRGAFISREEEKRKLAKRSSITNLLLTFRPCSCLFSPPPLVLAKQRNGPR